MLSNRNTLTTQALIHLTNKIRHDIDKGNYACEISVDFQKVFDTIDHHSEKTRILWCQRNFK